MKELLIEVLMATAISLAVVVSLEIVPPEQQRTPTSAELVAQTFSDLATWMPQTEWAFCYRNSRGSYRCA